MRSIHLFGIGKMQIKSLACTGGANISRAIGHCNNSRRTAPIG
ncbi:MAG TPA: hypothetical protein VKS44_17600 [Candidatus Acidoferrales bacterium]|nr:hypothetical protein [Candidatus Acidoferrales bacterium]